jgi:hypothetical protein
MQGRGESDIMPYEPCPGLIVKEIIVDPRNLAVTFCSGIFLGFLVELLIRVFA